MDGRWCEWSEWTECYSDVTSRKRSRRCECPPPVNAGDNCSGEEETPTNFPGPNNWTAVVREDIKNYAQTVTVQERGNHGVRGSNDSWKFTWESNMVF